MVDEGRARWALPDAIQRTEPVSSTLSGQPTITDSECEINAGAYAGCGLLAAERLSLGQMEAVRHKVALWTEIYDQKAPLPRRYRKSECQETAPGVKFVTSRELEQLSGLQITFAGPGPRPLHALLSRNKMGFRDSDLLRQTYADDEPEPLSDRAVGFHELDDSELES
jgi:hypothetical protein